MIEEFKAFIARGNVVDLAVGVMIGGAFGGIVTSLVNDIITPIVSLVAGSVDFSNYFLPLSSKVTATTLAAAREQGAVIAYGSFLTIVINFLILAWIIFLMVKGISKLRREEPAAPPEPAAAPADIQLLTEIRDLLKSRG
ncbi:large conductance mechanosensitive channel protein MscL [Gellertiella hungarica]|uniref:Large-conductance mechanosensitive channel n=1 Tax=Gellertiella hungarica TaxID=1572859 RepID=A0A7W6J350_9HYPH|nr:large conductance mechanosensitive channel protein MscL [Gellertiella hungarica]MBB4063931.1 large conductance mechanosensitive channel [Gellertiella hungarica]